MKDLHINQKSIINGVKRLTRGLCRVSSKVKNTNHILLRILAGEQPDAGLQVHPGEVDRTGAVVRHFETLPCNGIGSHVYFTIGYYSEI